MNIPITAIEHIIDYGEIICPVINRYHFKKISRRRNRAALQIQRAYIRFIVYNGPYECRPRDPQFPLLSFSIIMIFYYFLITQVMEFVDDESSHR